MPSFRLLSLALSTALMASAIAPDAQAQRKRAARAPAQPSACTDFHRFANGSWLSTHPTPATGAVSAMSQLVENTRLQQKALLDRAASQPANDVQKLLGDFWASGLDETAIEADGSKPIAPLLARIDALSRNKDLPATFAALHQVGIPVAFHFSADVDLTSLDRHIGYFMQGGTGLTDPAFYTRRDADTAVVMGRYQDYIKQILALTGTPANRLDAEARSVIALETRLAQQSQGLSSLNNPFNNFAPIAVAGLDRSYPNLQLSHFLSAQGVKDDQVSLADPAFFKTLDGLVKQQPIAAWKAYLRWRVGDAMAPYLSAGYQQAASGFRMQVLQGQRAPTQRWEHVLDAINTAAGPMLGREYTTAHLRSDDRRQAALVIDKVRDAQLAAIARNPRLSAEARTEATAKLQAMKIEIGAPLRDLDYSVQPMGRGSFGGNMLIAATWRHREEMKRIGRGNADRRWDVLPQQPSLVYDIAQNRIIVTAAVLQPPIYDAAAGTGVRFGSFGALVGHELTRAIDRKGAQVDARGTLRNWLSPADQAAWNALGDQLQPALAALAYPDVANATVDARRVRDSVLGDLSGLELAWQAYTALEPSSPASERQAFFIAWARLWPQAVAPAEAVARMTGDIHLPGALRAQFPPTHMKAFAQTFQCSASSTAGNPVQVWP